MHAKMINNNDVNYNTYTFHIFIRDEMNCASYFIKTVECDLIFVQFDYRIQMSIIVV